MNKPTKHEAQSGLSRVKWAEALILLLPEEHEGRNSWLLNFGSGPFASHLRKERGILWVPENEAAEWLKK